VIFCCGKLYYELLKQRETAKGQKPALIRLEQLYPFPEKELAAIIKTHKNAKKWFWVQEEPENMGGWQFVRPRIEAVIKQPPAYIGREAASSPATGFPAIFRREQNEIIEKAAGAPAGGKQQAEVG